MSSSGSHSSFFFITTVLTAFLQDDLTSIIYIYFFSFLKLELKEELPAPSWADCFPAPCYFPRSS